MMNTALWIVQILLAMIFTLTAALKITQPYEKLKEGMAWVGDFQPNQIKLIGMLEAGAVLGLILPGSLNILPFLIPLAALGLVLDMLGAAYTHYRHQEWNMIAVNVILGLLAAFVAVGRF